MREHTTHKQKHSSYPLEEPSDRLVEYDHKGNSREEF